MRASSRCDGDRSLLDEVNVNYCSHQPLQLGLFRSDYMIHAPSSDEPASLKQVEFNTISSSFGTLSQRTSELHQCVSCLRP